MATINLNRRALLAGLAAAPVAAPVVAGQPSKETREEKILRLRESGYDVKLDANGDIASLGFKFSEPVELWISPDLLKR